MQSKRAVTSRAAFRSASRPAAEYPPAGELRSFTFKYEVHILGLIERQRFLSVPFSYVNGTLLEIRTPDESGPTDAATPVRPKPYVSIRELTALTPWTEQAVRTMMAKGVLKEGEHFFHVGRRTVLKWDSIVGFIEHGEDDETQRVPLKRGGFVGGSSKK